MSRRSYWIYGNKSVPHNHVIINALEDDIEISSITAIGSDAQEVEIISQPTIVSKTLSVRYPVINSDRLRITVDHPLSEILQLSDLLRVSVGLENYNSIGKYVSPESEIGFNKNLSVIYDIDQILDVFLKCTIHLSAIDNYDNIVYSATIPTSINDDGFMIEHSVNSNSVALPYEPAPDSVKILIGSTEVDEFTIEGNNVLFSAPDGYDCFIIYKPLFTQQGMPHKITENVSINSSYGIQLVDNYCNKVVFSMSLEVFNPDTTAINHTPIIKSLGLLTSDR